MSLDFLGCFVNPACLTVTAPAVSSATSGLWFLAGMGVGAFLVWFYRE